MHFLDIKIHQNNTDISYKDTHADQCINHRSQISRKLKTSWVKSLYHRAHKICSNKQSLNKQVSQLKTFMSWNGYPKRVRNSAVKWLEINRSRAKSTDDDEREKIWLDLPDNGKQGEQLVPSRHAIFREYWLSVPSALQCSGHPANI